MTWEGERGGFYFRLRDHYLRVKIFLYTIQWCLLWLLMAPIQKLNFLTLA